VRHRFHTVSTGVWERVEGRNSGMSRESCPRHSVRLIVQVANRYLFSVFEAIFAQVTARPLTVMGRFKIEAYVEVPRDCSHCATEVAKTRLRPLRRGRQVRSQTRGEFGNEGKMVRTPFWLFGFTWDSPRRSPSGQRRVWSLGFEISASVTPVRRRGRRGEVERPERPRFV